MVTGAGATVMQSARTADAEFESSTLTVKFAGPAVAGVPLICEPDRLNPAGRDPVEIDHV